MSNQYIDAVLERSAAKGNARFVLMVIANFADTTGAAFPSIATLARLTGLGETTIHTHLRALVSSGELSIATGAGPSGTNRYQIHAEKLGKTTLSGGAKTVGVRKPQGAKNTTKGVRILSTPERKPPPISAPDPSDPPCDPSIHPEPPTTDRMDGWTESEGYKLLVAANVRSLQHLKRFWNLPVATLKREIRRAQNSPNARDKGAILVQYLSVLPLSAWQESAADPVTVTSTPPTKPKAPYMEPGFYDLPPTERDRRMEQYQHDQRRWQRAGEA